VLGGSTLVTRMSQRMPVAGHVPAQLVGSRAPRGARDRVPWRAGSLRRLRFRSAASRSAPPSALRQRSGAAIHRRRHSFEHATEQVLALWASGRSPRATRRAEARARDLPQTLHASRDTGHHHTAARAVARALSSIPEYCARSILPAGLSHCSRGAACRFASRTDGNS
jgi:hypothetical protein